MNKQYEADQMTNEELLLAYKETGDLFLKQELVLRYVHVVKSIAIHMRNVYANFTQLEDIVNEGVIALIQGIDKFDITMNVKFETFISKRIRGLVIDLARKQDWVPRSIRKVVKDIEQANDFLLEKLGRAPTEEEVADYMELPIQKYRYYLSNSNFFNVLSLDMVIEDVGDSKNIKGIKTNSHEITPEQNLLNLELSSTLKEAIQNLKENEQLVISLYYEKNLNMKNISKVMGISEPRVSTIHSNAIKKLREHMIKYNEEM